MTRHPIVDHILTQAAMICPGCKAGHRLDGWVHRDTSKPVSERLSCTATGLRGLLREATKEMRRKMEADTYKSSNRLLAEAAGYHLDIEDCGFIVARHDGGPVPTDDILGHPVAFNSTEAAWLAADMFRRGANAAVPVLPFDFPLSVDLRSATLEEYDGPELHVIDRQNTRVMTIGADRRGHYEHVGELVDALNRRAKPQGMGHG